MKIAIIDDDRLMLKSLQHTLEMNSHDVFITDSVDNLRSHILEEQIDLIISDVMMPDVENLAFLTNFKELGHRKLPVILISSLSDSVLTKKMSEHGLSDFLHKPFTNEQLLRKINYIALKNSL